MNWLGVDPAILAPPFAVGLAVLATHVPLGREVLNRGIIFLDLAVAQIAALGVIAANVLTVDASAAVTQIAALAAALIGATLLGQLEKRWPRLQEALIGSTFVVSASLGMLLLANDPHGGEQLETMLSGQILWSNWANAAIASVVAVAVLFLWFALPRARSRFFYLLFAVSITVSVQLVGLYLVFASLILPALSARALGSSQPDGRALAIGFVLGALAYLLGLLLSGMFDLPSGPLIVVALASVGLSVRGVDALFPRLRNESR